MDNTVGFLILAVLFGIFIYVIIMTKSIKDELYERIEKVARETVKEEVDTEIERIKDKIPTLIKSSIKNFIPEKLKGSDFVNLMR